MGCWFSITRCPRATGRLGELIKLLLLYAHQHVSGTAQLRPDTGQCQQPGDVTTTSTSSDPPPPRLWRASRRKMERFLKRHQHGCYRGGGGGLCAASAAVISFRARCHREDERTVSTALGSPGPAGPCGVHVPQQDAAPACRPC